MVLYRKFRPDNFASVKQQKVITDTLRSAIINHKVAHAYLFTGTRGTGKTSTARIFAKAINCLNPIDGEPCNTCEVCTSYIEGTNVDLIEIDAASNRGIDDIRDVKEKVNFAPTMSKYKVYIIDEVHMLTKDAFNALLKTLEEPPATVVFILATTEVYKVPLTVISRCQRFDFKNASIDELKALISEVSKKEKIVLDDETMALIADLAEGSFRDCLSILEKLHSFETTITYERALSILGIPDQKIIISIINNIKQGDIQKSLEVFKEGLANGIEVYQLNKNFLTYLEKKLVLTAKGEKDLQTNLGIDQIVIFVKEFLKAEEQLKYSVVPKVVIESAIVSLCRHFKKAELPKETPVEVIKQEAVNYDFRPSKPAAKAEVKAEPRAEPLLEEETPKVIEQAPVVEEIIEEAVDDIPGDTVSVAIEDVTRNWGKLIMNIKPFNHHLASFLAQAKPVRVDGVYLVMEVRYSFHKDRIEEIKSRDAFAKHLAQLVSAKLYPRCEVNSKLVIPTMRKSRDIPVVIEKKEEMTDNIKENIPPAKDVSDSDILAEAMKIFEVE